MRSMTGFGNACGGDLDAGISFRVEISSINRKQFELKCSMPHEVAVYESMLRGIVSEQVSRGSLLMRVEVRAFQAADGGTDEAFDLSLAGRYAEMAKVLQKKHNLNSFADAVAVLSIPGVAEAATQSVVSESTEKLLHKVAKQAVDSLVAMRTAEGERLKADLEQRLTFLENSLTELQPYAVGLPKLQYKKLIDRVTEAGFLADPSDERFLRELVIFTDKCDVTEEIVRLRSHFTHFRSVMENPDEPAGRPLDFITQEIFREVNTLGNKAPVPEISKRIVAMKTEVEKMREQVQNIE